MLWFIYHFRVKFAVFYEGWASDYIMQIIIETKTMEKTMLSSWLVDILLYFSAPAHSFIRKIDAARFTENLMQCIHWLWTWKNWENEKQKYLIEMPEVNNQIKNVSK